jgi:transposase InsO family protein
MKNNFQHISLAKLCGWFGVSRQAYYQNGREHLKAFVEEGILLQQVKEIRNNHRRIGTRKLYEMLQPFMLEHHMKIGRDALFTILSANGLLVRKRKRRIQTTNSYHRFKKYPNLIRSFVPTGINQLWVSDITYWKLSNEHVYISFITDAYSHKIVGYQVAQTMEAIESIHALQMATAQLTPGCYPELIHHSDRGIQYCSNAYVRLLHETRIKISMTENGDPLENAIAERINGIIKEEYLDTYDVMNIKEAKELLSNVVILYNKERPHMSISNLTPDQVHLSNQTIKTKRLWKNYYQKQTTFVNPL